MNKLMQIILENDLISSRSHSFGNGWGIDCNLLSNSDAFYMRIYLPDEYDYTIKTYQFVYNINGLSQNVVSEYSIIDYVHISIYKDCIKCRCGKYVDHIYEQNLQHAINENFDYIITKLKALDAILNFEFDFNTTYAEFVAMNNKIRMVNYMLNDMSNNHKKPLILGLGL